MHKYKNILRKQSRYHQKFITSQLNPDIKVNEILAKESRKLIVQMINELNKDLKWTKGENTGCEKIFQKRFWKRTKQILEMKDKVIYSVE